MRARPGRAPPPALGQSAARQLALGNPRGSASWPCDSAVAPPPPPGPQRSPYDTTKFASFAEPVPEVGGAVDEAASPTLAMLAATAKEHGVFLVGGECPGCSERATRERHGARCGEGAVGRALWGGRCGEGCPPPPLRAER